MGRELTQKNQNNESSDSEDEEMVSTVTLTDNPWLDSASKGDDLDEIFSGYRKFWEEKNEIEKKKQKLVKVTEPVKEVINESSSDESENISENENDKSAWVEEDLSDNDDSNYIENLFDKAEEKAISKVDTKLMSLKPKLLESFEKKPTNKKKKNGKNPQHDPKYLEFAKEAKLADIDVALNEGSDSEVEEEIRPSKRLLKEINEIKEEKKSFMRGTAGEIDPHSFLNVKSKHLLTAIPKSQEFDDVDEDELEDMSKSNKLSLAEAFENDDIINDFVEETEVTSKKEDVNQGLPGWGSWGGHNVKNRQKVEKPPAFKRKDRIIINNAPNEKLRKHLISSVPFPFTTVKDFEASMRLPVGKDFIPESAFRKLTAPSVVTKSGTIIEPMTEDVLVQNNRKTKRNGKIFKKRNFKA